MRKTALLPLLLAGVLACATDATGSDAATGGTLVIATGGDADFLVPPLMQSLQGRQMTDLMFYRLAELEPELQTVGDGGFEPRLASSWDWAADSLSIAFHIDPRARWHDGAPVRAADVVLSHSIYTDPVVASSGSVYFSNVDSVTARDSATAVFWFERRMPEQFYEVVHNLIVLPEHLLGRVDRSQLRASEYAQHPVGNGPYRLAKWERGARLELVADTAHWRGRPKLDRIIMTPVPEPTTAATRLLTGEADFFETLRAEYIAQAADNPDVRMFEYPSFQYAFMQFNTREPGSDRPHRLFAEREVRRAIAMAVDRERLVRSIYDTLAFVALGPFPRVVAPDTTMTQLPFDPDRARRLLDSLGWRDADGDGIRERGGQPLAFTAIVPTTSKPRLDASVIIQDQLRQIGARFDIEQLEWNAFLDRQRTRRFDATFGLWAIEPSLSGTRQTWGSRGESNYGRYSNPRFDALVDSALASWDVERSRAIFREAFQIIIDDAPAIWLYNPRLIAGHHRRIRVTGTRPDAWWVGIPQWSIPPGERIARDRVTIAARPE